ncbi:hypothetical protein CMA01_19550 [Carnobacterium maltaromaticum]|nr:hypothetical protein CMA01_19550 [Carnobacterium maltaromaticum]
MDISFAIGNGFDLNLGLKTNYSDFYKHVRLNKKELFENNIFFKRINKDVTYWEEFEIMLGIMTCYNPNETDFVDEIYKRNFKLNRDEISSIVKHIIEGSNDDISFETYDRSLEEFFTEFKAYISNEEKLLNLTLEENQQRIQNSILRFWHDFEEEEQSIFFEKVKSELQHTNTFNLNFSFLNFNYTSTLKNMIDVIDINNLKEQWTKLIKEKTNKEASVSIEINHYHVHASKDSGMFLGVDNQEQLKTEFFPDSDYRDFLIKPKKIEAYGRGNKSKYIRLIRNSHYIYIYGMSLGRTDSTWWTNALDSICERNSRKKVIIHYYANDFILDKGNYSFSKNSKIIRDLLLRYNPLIQDLDDDDLKADIYNSIIPIANSTIMFKS